MQSLKNIVINAAMILAISFGFSVSAMASDFSEVKIRAEQGDANSQARLGFLYANEGVRQDYSKALYWMKKSADQGYSGGQFHLGLIYEDGQGVRQDYSKALYWIKKSADQNYEFAQFHLGLIYEGGKGVRQNKTIAKEWYGKSCDNGSQLGCDEYKRLNEEGY